MIFKSKKIDAVLARVKIKLLKNSSLDTVFTSSNYSWSFDDDVKSSDLYICLLVLFVLFEWTSSKRKEVGIPLWILPHIQEQNKRSYFLGRVNPNTAAAGTQP